MSHKGKWRNICGIKKSQDCFNCTNKQKIAETKNKIVVTCDIGNGQRSLEFARHMTPYCGRWCQKNNEEFNR